MFGYIFIVKVLFCNSFIFAHLGTDDSVRQYDSVGQNDRQHKSLTLLPVWITWMRNTD